MTLLLKQVSRYYSNLPDEVLESVVAKNEAAEIPNSAVSLCIRNITKFMVDKKGGAVSTSRSPNSANLLSQARRSGRQTEATNPEESSESSQKETKSNPTKSPKRNSQFQASRARVPFFQRQARAVANHEAFEDDQAVDQKKVKNFEKNLTNMASAVKVSMHGLEAAIEEEARFLTSFRTIS